MMPITRPSCGNGSPAEATYAMVAAGAVTFEIPEMRKMADKDPSQQANR
jgi:hypothetical protein